MNKINIELENETGSDNNTVTTPVPEPVVTEPVVEQKVEEPVKEEDVVTEPIKTEPVIEPVKQEQVIDTPKVEHPIVSEPTVKEKKPILEEPKQPDPALIKMQESLDELTNVVKSMQKQEPVKQVNTLTFESLTKEQQADLLIHGETFVDENGRRVAPDMIIKKDDGSASYVEDEVF